MTRKQEAVYLKLARAVEKGLEEGIALMVKGFGNGVTCACPLTMVARKRRDFYPSSLAPACASLGITSREGGDIIAGFDNIAGYKGYDQQYIQQNWGPLYEVGQRLRQTYYETA